MLLFSREIKFNLIAYMKFHTVLRDFNITLKEALATILTQKLYVLEIGK
jgi:hypothetical protein